MEIKNNVPVPRPRKSWPFKKMQVGDHVDIPADEVKQGAAAARAYGQTTGKKFTQRSVKAGGIRIWRTV